MPESADRKPEIKSIPLAGANCNGNGGVVVKNPGCKDISSEGASSVEKPVQKDAASRGVGVGTVKQPPGKAKSEVKDKISVEKTAVAVETAAPESTGAGMGGSAVRQPVCTDIVVSAKSAPIEKAADVVENPVTVYAASGRKDVASATCSSNSGLVIVAETGVNSADAGVGTSDVGTVTDGSFDATTNAGTVMVGSTDTDIDTGTGTGGPSDNETDDGTVMVGSSDAETAVLDLPGPAAVGASSSPQGSASGTTSGKDKKTPKKKR